LIVDPPD